MASITTTPEDPRDDPEGGDFGDFASTEDEQIDLIEVAEPWHKYDAKQNEHVFYPICLGEVLDGRYLVEHKLGYGSFSTVWVAHDLQGKMDVALKVMASGDLAENDMRMQDEISQNAADTSHLVIYLATFLL
ncbi:STYKc [Aspergillus sclerotialis]|uniref:non-specific serine/threonine protein kinase n=1 Tax=Aspergillus sclerotialis TaxID=2070753 RepID=A0A3A2ZP01_9EURO|nr:STYKc [Aspergillus sclerotialis]